MDGKTKETVVRSKQEIANDLERLALQEQLLKQGSQQASERANVLSRKLDAINQDQVLHQEALTAVQLGNANLGQQIAGIAQQRSKLRAELDEAEKREASQTSAADAVKAAGSATASALGNVEPISRLPRKVRRQLERQAGKAPAGAPDPGSTPPAAA